MTIANDNSRALLRRFFIPSLLSVLQAACQLIAFPSGSRAESVFSLNRRSEAADLFNRYLLGKCLNRLNSLTSGLNRFSGLNV